jgi:hypothetical protein
MGFNGPKLPTTTIFNTPYIGTIWKMLQRITSSATIFAGSTSQTAFWIRTRIVIQNTFSTTFRGGNRELNNYGKKSGENFNLFP